MKRGEVWTASGGADYAGKPRPVVIVQDDSFGETKSITVCLYTSNAAEAALVRPSVERTAHNGLGEISRPMVDTRDRSSGRALDGSTMTTLSRRIGLC